jgi:hypothetical protein
MIGIICTIAYYTQLGKQQRKNLKKELEEIFNDLPDNLKDAHEWGMSDTLWRD